MILGVRDGWRCVDGCFPSLGIVGRLAAARCQGGLRPSADYAANRSGNQLLGAGVDQPDYLSAGGIVKATACEDSGDLLAELRVTFQGGVDFVADGAREALG